MITTVQQATMKSLEAATSPARRVEVEVSAVSVATAVMCSQDPGHGPGLVLVEHDELPREHPMCLRCALDTVEYVASDPHADDLRIITCRVTEVGVR